MQFSSHSMPGSSQVTKPGCLHGSQWKKTGQRPRNRVINEIGDDVGRGIPSESKQTTNPNAQPVLWDISKRRIPGGVTKLQQLHSVEDPGGLRGLLRSGWGRGISHPGLTSSGPFWEGEARSLIITSPSFPSIFSQGGFLPKSLPIKSSSVELSQDISFHLDYFARPNSLGALISRAWTLRGPFLYPKRLQTIFFIALHALKGLHLGLSGA